MSYICMQRVNVNIDGASPLRPIGAKLTACPCCGATCWDKELSEEMAAIVGIGVAEPDRREQERGNARKVCTECAIRRVGRPAGRSYMRPGRSRKTRESRESGEARNKSGRAETVETYEDTENIKEVV